jgi:hypothetical protein
MRHLCHIDITVVFISFSLFTYIAIDLFWVFLKSFKIKKWHICECVITDFFLENPHILRKDFDQDRKIKSLKNLKIKYRYSLDGKLYFGNKVSPDDCLLIGGNYSNYRMNLISSGAVSSCLVNPKNPHQSLIFSRISRVSTVRVFVSIFILFIVFIIGSHEVYLDGRYKFINLLYLYFYSFIISLSIFILKNLILNFTKNSRNFYFLERSSVFENINRKEIDDDLSAFKASLGFLIAPLILGCIHFLVCFLI